MAMSYIYSLMRNFPSSVTGRQFLKFAFVGFIGTLLNLAVLFTFTEFFGLYYIFSALIAFIVADTNNFILNKVFTFRERLRHKTAHKFGKFVLVSIAAICVNLTFLYIFTEFFGLYYIFSEIAAICIAMSINFTGNRKWTFRK